MVGHLGFPDWQPALVRGAVGGDITFPMEEASVELILGAEQVSIVRHMKHRLEGKMPWSTKSIGFADQYWKAGVNITSNLFIVRTSEDRARTGIRVEQTKVLRTLGTLTSALMQRINVCLKIALDVP